MKHLGTPRTLESNSRKRGSENSVAELFSNAVGWFGSLASSTMMSNAIRRNGHAPTPTVNGSIRIVLPQGSYKTRFVKATKAGWIIQAPLHRDSYVPLRFGDSISVEVVFPRGILKFQSIVLDRDKTAHTVLIEGPQGTDVEDRRGRDRLSGEGVGLVYSDSTACRIFDISVSGICLRTEAIYKVGDTPALKIPWIREIVNGRVVRITDGHVHIKYDRAQPLPRR